jgi:hypothetical protein
LSIVAVFTTIRLGKGQKADEAEQRTSGDNFTAAAFAQMWGRMNILPHSFQAMGVNASKWTPRQEPDSIVKDEGLYVVERMESDLFSGNVTGFFSAS